MNLLFIRLNTLIQLDDVAADKPHQVTEIWDCSFIPNVVQHVLVVHWRRREGRTAFKAQTNQMCNFNHEKILSKI